MTRSPSSIRPKSAMARPTWPSRLFLETWSRSPTAVTASLRAPPLKSSRSWLPSDQPTHDRDRRHRRREAAARSRALEPERRARRGRRGRRDARVPGAPVLRADGHRRATSSCSTRWCPRCVKPCRARRSSATRAAPSSSTPRAATSSTSPRRGCACSGLFDTHRAATLLGWPKVGLADLVRERLGVTLAKEHQQSDFSLRPLPPEMRDVHRGRRAVPDARLAGRCSAACVTADILEEVELDCERLADEAAAAAGHAAPTAARSSQGAACRRRKQALADALGARAARAAARVGGGGERARWGACCPTRRSTPAGDAPADGTVKELSRAQGVRGQVVREHGEEMLALLALPRLARRRASWRGAATPRAPGTRAGSGARTRSRPSGRRRRPSAR